MLSDTAMRTSTSATAQAMNVAPIVASQAATPMRGLAPPQVILRSTGGANQASALPYSTSHIAVVIIVGPWRRNAGGFTLGAST